MKDRSNINNDEFDAFSQAPVASESSGRSFSQVLREMIDHVAEIIRSEVRLARVEVREDIGQAARASVFFVIGTIFAFQAVAFLLLGAVYGLGNRMPLWLAAVIVGIGAGLIAAIFLGVGRTKMKHAGLTPDKTIRSLQENITWMKKQTR